MGLVGEEGGEEGGEEWDGVGLTLAIEGQSQCKFISQGFFGGGREGSFLFYFCGHTWSAEQKCGMQWSSTHNWQV